MPTFKIKNIVSLLFTAILGACTSDPGFSTPSSSSDNTVELSFSLELPPSTTRAATTLPAEIINTLRVVVVDLGTDTDSQRIGPAVVEYNKLYSTLNLKNESGYVEGSTSVELSIPKIKADSQKKIYFLINAEPAFQPYLSIKIDGTSITRLEDESLYLPVNDSYESPIDRATFRAPMGSYIHNDISGDEELFVPMTAVHHFYVPDLQTIAKDHQTINSKYTYPLPDLLVVRAVNKIWFDFVNMTYQPSYGYEALDLLITGWTLSDINHGESYLFGHPDETMEIFNSYSCDPYVNINKPWMQWIYAEGLRSQSNAAPQWLTDYDLPEAKSVKDLNFYPRDYTDMTENTVPTDNSGYYLPSPVTTSGNTLSTELQPVYFAESHSGAPQKYELTFNVWQRVKGGTKWENPKKFSITSATDPTDDSTFHLLSLFRNTDVMMEVKFITGRSGIDMVVELHPYGSVTLNPEFGL